MWHGRGRMSLPHPTSSTMIRIFLASEHPVILAGYRSFFRGTEFQVVGEATNRSELMRGLEQSCPHIVLIDTGQESFRLGSEGLPTEGLGTKRCRWEYRTLELSESLKSASKPELFEAVRRIAPKRISSRGTSLPPGTPARLTPREVQVLQLIVQGRSNKEIAKTLGISLDTVKEHVHNILSKTSQLDRTQAALWAVRHEIASL